MDDAQIYDRMGDIFHDVFDDDSIQVSLARSAKDEMAGIVIPIFA